MQKAIKIASILCFCTAVCSMCCSTVPQQRESEDLFISRKGEIPLSFRFPSYSKGISSSSITKMELKNKKNPRDIWILARHYHTSFTDRRNLDRAMDYYSLILLRGGKEASMARNNMACIKVYFKNYKDAERIFQFIINSQDPIITAYYNLSLLYRYAGRTGDAVKVLVLMDKKYPENIYAAIQLGDILVEKNKINDAEKYFLTAVKRDRENPVPLHRLALLHESAKRYSTAESYFKVCLTRFPSFSQAYLDYSKMLLKLNQKEKARQILHKGLGIHQRSGHHETYDSGSGK